MSDHSPLSLSSSKTPPKKTKIPAWVVSHKDFKQEVEAELNFAVKEHTEKEGKAPSPYEEVKLLKQSLEEAAKHIRSRCADMIAQTTAHKLAITMSFIKAINENDDSKARQLQKRYPRLSEFKLNNGE